MNNTDSTHRTADLLPWIVEGGFAELRETYDRQGYLIFPRVLSESQIAGIREALAPHLEQNLTGRNDFEGRSTNRVYSLLAKSPVFAELAIHPLALAFAEADLGETLLLSSCLAINLHPGETVQAWHFDDGHCPSVRPRDSWGVSAFWAIDELTETNGATEFIPGSHRWTQTSREDIPGFDQTGSHPEAKKAIMPAGSLMIAKGTLWHRGGANRSRQPRLVVTPQYCPGWIRQLENMTLAVPPSVAKDLPERARELLGYSIQPPFMGHVNGRHPDRLNTGV